MVTRALAASIVADGDVAVARRTSAGFSPRRPCVVGAPPLVIAHVDGPQRVAKMVARNLHFCRALQQPGVLAGTLSAPRHLPHSQPKSGIRLFATNPSAITEDLYLVRLTSYSHCSDNKDMKFLRRYEYERNSVTAVLSKRRGSGARRCSASRTRERRARALRPRRRGGQRRRRGVHLAQLMELEREPQPHDAAPPPLAVARARGAAGRPQPRKGARPREELGAICRSDGRHAAGGAAARPAELPAELSRARAPTGGSPRVLYSYTLEPHIVLACRPADGHCRRLHSSSARELWARRVPHTLGR